MKISRKILGLITTSFVAIILSVRVGMWASETYFFDNFYYFKSVKHGYWVPNRNLKLKDFGQRGKDIAQLFENIHNSQRGVLGTQTDNNIFTIAIFGDSYVWGQGIREEDRFVRLLEKQLNRLRPTHIISLGNSGDGFLDNYIKYLFITKSHRIDLAIFGVLDNDLLIREQNLYDESVQQKFLTACAKPIVIDGQEPRSLSTYKSEVKQSYDRINFGNWCIFEKSLENLPKTHTLFFNYGEDFGYPDLINEFTGHLIKNGYSVLSVNMNIADKNRLRVSNRDGHPSAYTNRVFADSLFESISKLDYFRQ